MRRFVGGVGCLGVGFALACSGLGDKPVVIPVVAEPEPVVLDAGPLSVPPQAAPFIGDLAVSRVEVLDGRTQFSFGEDTKLSDVDAVWGKDIHRMVEEPTRWIGARWDGQKVGLAMAELRGGALTVTWFQTVPGLDLPVGNCGGAELAVTATWPDRGVLDTCVAIGGDGGPVGPFRVRRNDTAVIDGAFSEQGRRVGPWTVRSDSGLMLAEGVFRDDQPDGSWRFYYDGDQHEVAYKDGQQDSVPFVQLPVAHAEPLPVATAAIDLLDANLETGVVAARISYNLVPDPSGTPPAACPLLGRVDPVAGMALVILQAGKREPVGRWEVYRAVAQGADCPTEDEAVAALAEATAVFAKHGLTPSKGVQTMAPVGEDLFDGLVLQVGTKKVTTETIVEPLSLEAQLRSPDLLPGVWTNTSGQQVRGASILVDGRPVDEIWMRWRSAPSSPAAPTACDAKATVAVGIRQGPRLGLLYRITPCEPGGPIWALGVPLRI